MTSAAELDLITLVEAERERFGVPGCAVVVVHDGEVVLQQGFGVRDTATGAVVTTSTLFPIGSSTKTFTAAVCALAAEAGLIGWDEPIAPHLPEFALKDPVASQQLTLRDALAHRSGLPRHDLLWYAASDGSLTRTDLIRTLRHLEPNRGFREAWQYNNLLYTTAGELAGRLFGTSYEDAVRTQLLEPLGMKRTGFRVADLEEDPDAAVGYVVAPEGGPAAAVPYASLDLVGPAGNINSCADEMARWLLELVGGRPDPVVPASVLDLLRTPVMPLSDVSPLTIGRSVGYGAGLAIDDYRGHRVFHHGGNIDGFSSQVSVLPETRSGVVVLCNRSSTGLRDALPYVLYDALLGLAPHTHGTTTLEKEQALRAAYAAVGRPVTPEQPRPAVRPLEEYAGTYRHPGYGDLAVVSEGDGLAVRYRAVSGVLNHVQLEVFDLHADLGGEDRHLPVQFFHDLAGDVSAVAAVLEPAIAPVRFERVVDTSHLTPELLRSMTGTYSLATVSLVVTAAGERLTVRINGGQPKVVSPAGGLRFRSEGITVEFLPPDAIRTPFGEFVRSPDSST
jgi:CubicO group peptidase (beta-lactamase class C family)